MRGRTVLSNEETCVGFIRYVPENHVMVDHGASRLTERHNPCVKDFNIVENHKLEARSRQRLR